MLTDVCLSFFTIHPSNCVASANNSAAHERSSSFSQRRQDKQQAPYHGLKLIRQRQRSASWNHEVARCLSKKIVTDGHQEREPKTSQRISIFNMNHLFCRCLILFLTVILPTASSFSPIQQGRSVSLKRPSARSALTIEREDTITLVPVDPAVEEMQSQPDKTSRKDQGSETWEVRIYNDGLNTREHVARSLVMVTGIPEFQAYKTMMHAHTNGMASVGQWVYEVAELYHDALRGKGIICDLVPVDEQQ